MNRPRHLTCRTGRLAALLPLLLVLLAATSCSNLLGSTPERLYLYRAVSDEEVPILFGRFILAVATNDEITGEWQIDWIDGISQEGNVGPQIGRGSLRGTLLEGFFHLNLNPELTDNNVVLVGHWGDGDLSGEWGVVGIGGIVVRGGFTLERIRTPH